MKLNMSLKVCPANTMKTVKSVTLNFKLTFLLLVPIGIVSRSVNSPQTDWLVLEPQLVLYAEKIQFRPGRTS